MGTSVSHTLPAEFATPGRLARPDGVRLAYERHGRPGAPAVLFAHGFGQTRQAWGGSARALAEAGYEAIAADGRGHGESDWSPLQQPYAMEQFVDDLAALAATSAQPPILVGASMGGLLGLFSEGRAPGCFSALVLVDITPRWEAEGVERILGFMGAHPDGFDSYEHASSEIAAYLPHRRSRKSPEQLRSLLVRRPDGRLRWHWDPRLLEQIGRDGERYQDELMAAARRVSIPTLLISGGLSDLVSERTVEEFLALVPHAGHTRIEQATHMVAGDRNDQFTSSILDFLTVVAPAATSTGALS